MKIDQSICNDWTLSPLKNCLKACGLKIKIASEQSVSLALCAGVSCRYLHFLFYVFVCVSGYMCVSEHSCVLFMMRAHACFVVHGWHCLYPGAVLPVRSQVFINLDSGRQITRPQAATHPSFQGLPKTAFNMHYSFPCCYKPNFQLLSLGFSLACCRCPSAGKHRCGDVCRVVCIFRGTTLFSLNSCFPSRHFEWHCPLHTVLRFPAVRSLPPQVVFDCVCLHICVRLSVCGGVWERLLMYGIGKKNRL